MTGTIKTVTEQIYQDICKSIMDRSLPAGTKLTIKSLNERYGVSSSPIREALAHLQQDGLIEYKPNVGMSVVTLTKKDVHEIFTLILELDKIAMRFAMESPKAPEIVENLSGIQDYLISEEEVNDEWLSMSDEFHKIFYHYADNSRLTESAEKLRKQLTILSTAYEQSGVNRQEICEQHERILDALETGNISAAEDLMKEHLLSSYRKAMEVVENENAPAAD